MPASPGVTLPKIRAARRATDMALLQGLLKDTVLTGKPVPEILCRHILHCDNPPPGATTESNLQSVGEYITGLMENRMDREQKNGVTLRQVYYQW